MGTTKIIKSTRGYTLEGDPVDLNVHSVDGLHLYDESSSGYIRIGNLQICWGMETEQETSAGQQGSIYHTDILEVFFPVNFLGYPTVTVGVYEKNPIVWAGRSSSNQVKQKDGYFGTGFTYRLLGARSTASGCLFWIAIGKWK